MTPIRNVYLSAVSAEFQSYIDELAQNLTRRGFVVKTREDFQKTDGNRLEKIEEFIRNCDTVICLVGSQFGEEPPAEEAQTFADISRNRQSYAQWEYLFGAHVGKSVHAFLATDDTPRDNRNHEPAEAAELQHNFSRTWIESGVNGAAIEFKDIVELRVEALVLKELTPTGVVPQIERKLTLTNPYPGFRKFTEQDGSRFFGRDALIQKIINQVSGHTLTTVFGKSGSGKSSVIRAGVIPKFLQQFPGQTMVFTPGENPFEHFSTALTKLSFPEEITALAAQPSANVFRTVRQAAGSPNQPWLIFIDQFEEVFTRPTKHNAPLILQFIRSLIDVASAENQMPMRLVLAVRDDFLGRMGDYTELAEVCDQNLVRITPPNWTELCEMIELPAAKHGVRYEPELVSRIVSHTEGEGQSLPKLQYALHRLWEVEKSDLSQFAQGVPTSDEDKEMGGLHDRKINRSSYKAINGVPHALTTRIKELFGNHTITERRQLKKILTNLMIVAETDTGLAPISRSMPRNLISQAGGVGSDELIQTLINEGILVESEIGNNEIELAHEILLYEWKDLADWSNDARDAAEFKRDLYTDARIWAAKRNERTDSFSDLWGGARLQRARELSEVSDDSGQSAFDRIGGLDDLEKDFLVASSDRSAKEMRYDLAESATAWRTNKKSKGELWAGPKLNRALEMNELQEGESQTGFDRVGGLEKNEQKFLQASKKHLLPKPKFLWVILVLAALIGIISFFTPLDDIITSSILPEGSGLQKFFDKVNNK